ncbi:hypothetical protein COLO4_05503 [Corchorus olitorius]|uniref:Uncharacterized protein n=1 Tax=Corchorus olitorius TaxID=93759 RepID=A0A1R3KQP5_9ROSI|nr:hypothetical protein COLO4_05503 [Corchorus olitorius]
MAMAMAEIQNLKWSRRGSNPRPSAHKTNALTN